MVISILPVSTGSDAALLLRGIYHCEHRTWQPTLRLVKLHHFPFSLVLFSSCGRDGNSQHWAQHCAMTWAVPRSLLVEATTFALLLSMSAHLGEKQLQEWQNCAIIQTLYHASVSALTRLLKCVRERLRNTLSGNFSSNFWLTFTHRGIPTGASLFWFLHLPLICYDIQGCAETARSPSLMLPGRKHAARG